MKSRCSGTSPEMSLSNITSQYIGIAKDEQERLLRLEGGRQVSLLAKYNLTEQDAWQLCEDAGLLSPVYAFTDRGVNPQQYQQSPAMPPA